LAFFAERVRALVIAAFVGLVIVAAQPVPRAEASGGADAVIAHAMHHLGAPWRYGAVGPYAFDCTGLAIHAFRAAGYYSRIGSGSIRSARQFYYWFRARGLATRTGGRRGDLVVYGGGTHVGIYLGDGRVISTLTRGVSIHGLHAVIAPFTAFLRTGLSSGGTTGGTAGSAQGGTDVMSGQRSGGAHAGTAGSTAGSQTTTGASSTTRRVTAWRLNFRLGPGTSYRIIGVLTQGTRLTVLSSGRDRLGRTWYRVRAPSGRLGWVAGWYTRP
jgi:SH3 domain-containing protein/NlpC/P60 family protein